MKKLIFTLLVIPTAAFAGSQDQGGVPTDAVLLFQTEGAANKSSQLIGPDISLAVDHAIIQIAAAEQKVPNLELNCQTIYRNWSSVRDVSHGEYLDSCTLMGAVNIFEPGSACKRYKYIKVNVYCQPRDLQQQQIMSLMESCRKDPKPECFSEKFLEYLGKFQRTKFIDINKPG